MFMNCMVLRKCQPIFILISWALLVKVEYGYHEELDLEINIKVIL